MRRLGAAPLLTATFAISFALPVAAARPADELPPVEPPGFSWPAPDQLTYAYKGPLTVTWNAGDVVTESWRLVRSVGLLDLDGGCITATFEPEPEVDTTETSATLTAHLPDRCYRYDAWSAEADPNGPPTYESGVVRTLRRWHGSVDLYRNGAFASQATMRWCVGASVQMMLNLVLAQSDNSATNQETYFRYARKADQYTASDGAKGTDAQGWADTLVHFGGGSYAWVSNDSFKRSIRQAALAIRETGKPVGLVVAHSNHAWVMTGFDAKTDPALDSAAVITAVYVMGPLYPRPAHNGYDPAPDTRIAYQDLKRFHSRYFDSLGPDNPWEGTFVTIQPVIEAWPTPEPEPTGP